MEKNNDSKNKSISRNLKYGTNAAIMVVAVIVIAVLLNVIVGMLDIKLDLTPNKLFSFSETTENILKELDQDVRIIGLFDDGVITSNSEYKQVTDLLSLYEKNPHIKVEYIDPEKNPGVINQLDPNKTMGLRSSDFIIVSNVNGNEKKKKLEYYDLFAVQYDQYSFQPHLTGSNAEQGFTGAIRYVTAEHTPVVYFTEGHDENNVDYVYSNLKDYLEKNNYQVSNLDLRTVDKIPEDCELVVVASPKNDFLYTERDLLDSYIYNGGNVIFMFDYLENDPSFDELNGLLSKYNLAIDYDKVKENDQGRYLNQDPYMILADGYANSIVPQDFSTYLSDSRSISILKNEKDYLTTTSLLTTSENAVGEMINSSRGEDIAGPLDIAVAVEYKGGMGDAKIVAMGNSSFISDDLYSSFGNLYINNMNFFLQTMGWMIGQQEDEVILPTKNFEVNTFEITQLQSRVMGGVLIIVLPLLIFGMGLMVYLRRRHL